jgi:hypothetical protein
MREVSNCYFVILFLCVPGFLFLLLDEIGHVFILLIRERIAAFLHSIG